MRNPRVWEIFVWSSPVVEEIKHQVPPSSCLISPRPVCPLIWYLSVPNTDETTKVKFNINPSSRSITVGLQYYYGTVNPKKWISNEISQSYPPPLNRSVSTSGTQPQPLEFSYFHWPELIWLQPTLTRPSV